MKKGMILAVALACLMTVSTAFAGPGCKPGCGAGENVAKASCSDATSQATLAKLMTTMPRMQYQVGDASTCCPDEAKAHAQKSNKDIMYVVGKKQFTCEKSATAHLASLLESEVQQLMAVRFEAGGNCYNCPMAATAAAKSNGGKIRYQVAGFTFDDQETANRAARVVAEAVSKMGGCSKSCCGSCDGKGAKTASGKGGCSKSCGSKNAQTASAGKSCCGSCDGKGAKTASGKGGCSSPCGSKDAQTASAGKSCCGSCDGKGAKTASGKGGCSSPCGSKDAQTASAGKSCCGSCDGKGAKTASGKGGCSSPCGSKDAQTASAGKSCCGSCDGKGAKTASGKSGCSSPCGSKDAQTASAGKSCCGSCDGKGAKTASGKGSCSKSCGGAKAASVASTTAQPSPSDRIATSYETIRVIVTAASTVASS